jgi:hypothetical protein
MRILLLALVACSGLFGQAQQQVLVAGGCNTTSALSGGIYDTSTFSGWTTQQASIGTTPGVNPDCSLTSTTIVEDTSTNQHDFFFTVTHTFLASTLTMTVYAKQSVGSRNIGPNLFSSSFASKVFGGVQLSNCTVNVAVSVSGTWTSPTLTATPVQNGWCKIVMSATISADTAVNPAFDMLQGTSFSYTGDGASSVALWGLDLR